jgi:hypothetical protein
VVLIDRDLITKSKEGDIGAFNEMVRNLQLQRKIERVYGESLEKLKNKSKY